MSDEQPNNVLALRNVDAPEFKLGGFAQDKLTNYAGKLVACTTYLHGPTSWGLLSMRALRQDLGGRGQSTPQVFDWYPENRLEPLSAEEAEAAGRRQADARDRREDEVYRRGNGSGKRP